MSNDSHLYLFELEDSDILTIINLPEHAMAKYINALIERFYPKVEFGSEKYVKLFNSYKSGFFLENAYRASELVQSSYTPIYTKTGLIREIVCDLYALGKETSSVH